MTIDDTGKWSVGSSASDIGKFLEGYASKGYESHAFRLAKCPCGGDVFQLFADDNEGVAKRECVECGAEHFICDSEKYWTDADPEECVCVECNSHGCNVGVGFSLYEDKGAVKWLYVGVRCAACGTLGCFAGWKVGYEPSLQLMDQV